MAVHFHPLAVKEIRRETADCVSISFDIPADLKDVFKFQQGQNITIKALVNGEECRRSYSICSAPYEAELRVAVKQISGGRFSTYANASLITGDILQVMPPTGKFNTNLDPLHKKNYVAFAAGSGITAIISLIKTTLDAESQSKFTLVYSNRNKNSIIFFEEIEALKNKYLQRFNLIHLLSREKTDAPINEGRIDNSKMHSLSALINYQNIDEFFICGPAQMMVCVKEYLQNVNIIPDRIHTEMFTVPGQQVVAENSIIVDESLPKSKINIRLDGRSFGFDLAFNADTILDAALKQGADLPFACKGGVCATCRAKVVSGEIKMKVNYALEAAEIANGFILTCQAIPISDGVMIDFDIK